MAQSIHCDHDNTVLCWCGVSGEYFSPKSMPSVLYDLRISPKHIYPDGLSWFSWKQSTKILNYFYYLNIDYCIFIHVTNGLCHKRRTVQEVPYNLIYHFSGFESHFSNRVAGDSQVRRFFEQCIDTLQNYLAVSEFLGDISILFFYGFYGRNQ